mmetsp:Transcript_1036/g.2211  ORF Transcript_1036/g.2211 Transcript_1036/m.2211 type:complete len:230 (-) Transcript_1036:1427-2116(-)
MVHAEDDADVEERVNERQRVERAVGRGKHRVRRHHFGRPRLPQPQHLRAVPAEAAEEPPSLHLGNGACQILPQSRPIEPLRVAQPPRHEVHAGRRWRRRRGPGWRYANKPGGGGPWGGARGRGKAGGTGNGVSGDSSVSGDSGGDGERGRAAFPRLGPRLGVAELELRLEVGPGPRRQHLGRGPVVVPLRERIHVELAPHHEDGPRLPRRDISAFFFKPASASARVCEL